MAGLYIHVPFCHTKCAYCDFYSLPRADEYAETYVNALHTEWDLRKDETGEISTIYFGGGTPSLLFEKHIERLSEWLPKTDSEFTVEFNPEDVTESKLEVWKSVGANRVSMGIQSLNDAELKFVGRRHTAREALNAYELIRTFFNNVSVDLIIGLPGQTAETLTTSLETVLSLRPEHISVYILSYEEGTRLWAMKKTGKIEETDDNTIALMYATVCRMMKESGYEHYEISNFALPGCRARHNSAYWAGTSYLGLGPAAHSYDGKTRRVNPSNIKEWLKHLLEGQPACVTETESEEDRVNNLIMTRLRTAEGLCLNDIPENFRQAFSENMKQLPPKRIVTANNRIYIPEEGWLLSDDTIATLFID